jgi:tRNA threonylcarbamoyladenosine biosynthesis protein TsaE
MQKNSSLREQDVPILKEGQLDIISHSAEQTQRLGLRLGTLLRPGDVICLSGDMGAGKTVFAAGIGKGWGAKTPLTSPTFNLVHEHSREADSQRLFHLDCYRLESADEVDAIGFDDILNGPGPAIIEWPEHIIAALPRQRLWIELRILEPTRRNFIFEATGKRYEELIQNFREATFGV